MISCSICNKTIQGKVVRGQFYYHDVEAHTCGPVIADLDICPECFDKLTGESNEDILTRTGKKRKTEYGNKSKLDDGKIWALYTGKIPWTMKQIAEEMGTTTQTIYYHIKRMRE